MRSAYDAVIVSVCRSGGDFRPEHARTLHSSLHEHNPHLSLLHACLTDYPMQGNERLLALPLERGYRGRWAQIECFDAPRRLFEAGIVLGFAQRYVYLDLDTVPVDRLDPLLRELDSHPDDRIACLEDLYRPRRLEVGVMGWRGPKVARTIAERFAAEATETVPRDPEAQTGAWMRRRCDDLAVVFDRWQAGILSYKIDLRDRERFLARMPRGTPPALSLVVFHGKPRPWHVGGEAGTRDMIARKLPQPSETADGP